ncbi:MAG: hypothetical protein OHK0012_07400 [Synechococcales cyanobacterium]
MKIQGCLHYRVWRQGWLLEDSCQPNLITDAGLTALPLGWAGDGDGVVTQIGFGSSPVAPTPEDADLLTPFVKPLTGYGSNPGAVVLLWDLLPEEANGLAIAEFGLFTEAEVLVARRIRASPLIKTSALYLQGSWTLSLSR